LHSKKTDTYRNLILSASRRTDIPAFYSDWFYNRIKAGFVCVRNPMNAKQISKIPVNKEVTDCIVFWTKNPEKMLPRLHELNEFNFYFQFTLTPYNQTIEPFISDKTKIINTFKKLSNKIGSQRIIWRYDPILLSQNTDIEYHIKEFEHLAAQLKGYTQTCTISFIDMYPKIADNMMRVNARKLSNYEIEQLAGSLAEIARSNHIQIKTCAEQAHLEQFGITHGKCIDNELIESIVGAKIKIEKDKNQRTLCQCVQSIDIGEYSTCPHACIYCYANSGQKQVHNKLKLHNPNSPLLIGEITANEQVTERKVASLINQRNLFM
jgi:DNA repair photolyase